MTASRTTGQLTFWLFTDFTCMLLSVYWLHNAWYRHQEGASLLFAIGLMIWTGNFRADIRRWTGPKR
jgi:hypothetical protein